MTDHWHDTIAADIRQLRRAAHDACTVTWSDTSHPLFEPKDKNDKPAQAMRQEATRGNDRDADYVKIPSTHIRTGERSDPTFRAAESAHNHNTEVCTQLASLVDDFYYEVGITLHPYGRDVIGLHGSRYEPPDVTWRETDSGRRLVELPPSDVGRFIDECCDWLHTVDTQRGCAGAVDALLADTGADNMHGRRAHLQARTRHTVQRLTSRQPSIPPSRRPCLNPGGHPTHRAGPDHVNGVCVRCRTYTWCRTCGLKPRAENNKGYTLKDCWSCINARNYRTRRSRVAEG